MAQNKRIIIVEDDRDFRESIMEYLALAGFEVTGVASALDFYQKIARERYLLVILDISLPDQDGLVLAEYVRKNTDMRIIMLTAQSSQKSKVIAYESGADLYLTKPVDFPELLASITSILGRLTVGTSSRPEPEPDNEKQHWQLQRNDWSMLTPKEEIIQLTAKEFDLIEKLASLPNQVVERQVLLKALDYENDEFGNRSLDALIHRLRRKKDGLSCRIPIKTAHGSGYCFSEPIVII
ncbi:MAG: response regulator transcription factor [Chlorobium sp.]|jgi:DNA-binding response OmpR family regulator|uniref:response regulator transcription factor n=1 Tax=Chlorobium sp. TaxID=1095 RepID=UPI001D6A98AC|nr:response regulator transcription factor [Chlorobium sp.]MBN1279692.1 response regulator transcription factor [Chlorobiaceae bacterium]MCF8215439.1 response regulator transcription factor [Chlorobium sp.]MCF8270336.1 response regulator transcription factor [Chlorobium sp.]MCF8286646.1 response regulator transcription factor [Chlorobium sp.]MCF8290339.1 response regulator transcription factor [Chlorobium sp.]